MSLAVGTRLGHYEILAPIGAGGMGEVYKARDTRLNRIVAIKASQGKFTERFEREARAVAALNHPNICQLYDVGADYLVLEYVEGVPVSPTDNVRKLLDVAVQIADGMAAAHATGFLHRDLKPANVLVTSEGRVKILDFGLAKELAKPDQPDGTQALTLTDPGMVAGTAAYMSPEQARRSNLDARSDQFSFGLMLYEIAAGRHPFKRPTMFETLAAIIRNDPEPLPANILAPLRWIIHRCLAKEPRDRYESSRDLFLELRSLREHLSDTSSPTALSLPEPKPKMLRGLLAGMAIGFAAAAVLAAIIAFLPRSGAPERGAALRFVPFSFEQGGQCCAVWSPDGKAVAFGAAQKDTDRYQVYVRYLDSPVATPITHLAEPALPVGWTSAGRIVFRSTHKPFGLWSVSPVGGEPELLLALAAEDFDAAASFSVSPDGSAIALLHKGDDGVYGVWISSPPGAPLRKYDPAPFASRGFVNMPTAGFSPDGKQILLFRNAATGEEAWLLPYPANSAKPPHRVLQKLPGFKGTPSFSWMPDSRHVVLSTTPVEAGLPQLYMADTGSGDFSLVSSGTTEQSSPAVSPDGDRLVFQETTDNFDIVTVNLQTLAMTPLIATQRSESMPAWSSGGSGLTYVTDRSGDFEIWLHKAGDSEDRPLVTARDFPPNTTLGFMNPILSPDGARIIYTRIEREGSGAGPAHLWMSAVSGGKPVQLLKGEKNIDFAGSWSPDGNWLVYWEDREGRVSLDKVKTTGQAEPEILKADIQRTFSVMPVWSPAGDWILYSDRGMRLISPDGKMTRDLSSLGDSICTFSGDGARLYCVRADGGPSGRVQIFSSDLEGKQRMIGSLDPEYFPSNRFNPSQRVTLTPDGKSITYSTRKQSSNLWLIDGLESVARR